MIFLVLVSRRNARPPFLVAAAITYLEAITRHFVRHDCSRLLIENYLDEPFKIWEVVAVAPQFGRHTDDCIEVAIVEMKAKPTGQRELKIQMGPHRTLTVRVFEDTSEAKAWFSE